VDVTSANANSLKRSLKRASVTEQRRQAAAVLEVWQARLLGNRAADILKVIESFRGPADCHSH
jgi:hypothetical protein